MSTARSFCSRTARSRSCWRWSSTRGRGVDASGAATITGAVSAAATAKRAAPGRAHRSGLLTARLERAGARCSTSGLEDCSEGERHGRFSFLRSIPHEA